jgi:hypothetical protein|tara:strand:- start:315 stop:497 length:183 start_codon:yes stop_codon:yes gene_type:complete
MNITDQMINACRGNTERMKVIIDGMSKDEIQYRIDNFFFSDLNYDYHDEIIKSLNKIKGV